MCKYLIKCKIMCFIERFDGMTSSYTKATYYNVGLFFLFILLFFSLFTAQARLLYTWKSGRIFFLLCLGSVTSPIIVNKQSFNKNPSTWLLSAGVSVFPVWCTSVGLRHARRPIFLAPFSCDTVRIPVAQQFAKHSGQLVWHRQSTAEVTFLLSPFMTWRNIFRVFLFD